MSTDGFVRDEGVAGSNPATPTNFPAIPKPSPDSFPDKYSRPQHRVDILTAEWPTGLKTLEDAARDLGVTPERLLGLSDGGYAPHYRVDGGPPQFKVSELKRWAAINLVERIEGHDFPAAVRVVVPAPQVQDFRRVPLSLREVVGLCDISDEALRTGVYFICRDGALLYVGQSTNAANRIADHYRKYEFDTVLFLPWPADDLNRLEAALIRALRPPLNGKSVHGMMRTSMGDAGADAELIASITNPPKDEP